MRQGTRTSGHVLADGPAQPATPGDDTGAAAPRRRHSAELYDAIWSLALPRVDKVDPAVVRLVLLAIAKHTNPSRDGGQFRCCPTVETLAQLADVSERQVQRVLARFVELGYLEVETSGVRAGRGRAARPGWWCLRPDRWPQRTRDGGVPQDATIAEVRPMVASPRTRLFRNGGVPQDAEGAMVASPGSPKPVKGLTRKTGVPPLGVADVDDGAIARKPEDSTQPALPRMGAVALAPPGQGPAEDLLAAFYRGLGTDLAALTPTLLRRELAIAVQLVAVGATPAEAEAYAREASAMPGRIAAVDLRAFERERVSWLARRRRSVATGPRLIDRTGQPPSWSSASVGERAAGERHDSTAGALARAIVGGAS